MSGTFNYSIPLTGGCGSVNATGTITVTPANTVGVASSTPTLCINTALTPITHTTTGATGIGVPTKLPAGVTAALGCNTITISGTPTAAGTFNYSIPLTGGCGTVNATGTITVAATNTVGAASSTPNLCINTALTPVTHTTTGATGIGVPSNLPAGVTASWASNTITISGTPSAAGTFNYTIPLAGGCGSINATGTITVRATNTASVASSTPTLCINTALTSITHTTSGATGIGTATGLPAGVTASWACKHYHHQRHTDSFRYLQLQHTSYRRLRHCQCHRYHHRYPGQYDYPHLRSGNQQSDGLQRDCNNEYYLFDHRSDRSDSHRITGRRNGQLVRGSRNNQRHSIGHRCLRLHGHIDRWMRYHNSQWYHQCQCTAVHLGYRRECHTGMQRNRGSVQRDINGRVNLYMDCSGRSDSCDRPGHEQHHCRTSGPRMAT